MTTPHPSHGTAMLLVRCEPQPDMGPVGCPRCPKCMNGFDNGTPADKPHARRCAKCKTVFYPFGQPHTAGDLIQVGDQQAHVIEVLPPVRVSALSMADALKMGFEPPESPDAYSDCPLIYQAGYLARCVEAWWTEDGGSLTDWVWRVRVEKI